MKPYLFLTSLLATCLASYATGHTPAAVVSPPVPHTVHAPWLLFMGIVLAAAILSAITIANAEPKN